MVSYVRQYDQGAIQVKPGITVRDAKLFLDGVIAAPALTGAVLEPYRVNAGTPENPHWIPAPTRGPAIYFPPKPLAEILVRLARRSRSSHARRWRWRGADIRPALAHDEIVSPHCSLPEHSPSAHTSPANQTLAQTDALSEKFYGKLFLLPVGSDTSA